MELPKANIGPNAVLPNNNNNDNNNNSNAKSNPKSPPPTSDCVVCICFLSLKKQIIR